MPMQKTDIKIWVMNNRGYDTPHVMEREIAAFQKLYPNITVECSVISWSQAWYRIISAVKSKQTPDIFQVGSTWTTTLSVLNALMNITDRVKKDNLKEKFVPYAWSSCESKALGLVYAVPWFIDLRLLCYRKDVLKKKGLSELCLSTWESFEKTCEQINGLEFEKKRIVALGVPLLKDQGLILSIAPWIWSAGGDFLSPDGKRPTFHNRQALEGIKFYFNLIHKGYTSATDESFTGEALVENFFADKRQGFIFEGVWAPMFYLPGFFETSPDSSHKHMVFEQFGIAPPPSGPAGRFTFCGGSNLAISNYSAHPDEAWELINFLCTNESQLRHCQAVGNLPSVGEAFELMFKQDTEQNRVLRDSYQKLGRSYPQAPLWASIEMVLTEEFYNILQLIRAKQYTEALLVERMNKAAERVNYLLSL